MKTTILFPKKSRARNTFRAATSATNVFFIHDVNIQQLTKQPTCNKRRIMLHKTPICCKAGILLQNVAVSSKEGAT